MSCHNYYHKCLSRDIQKTEYLTLAVKIDD